MTYFRIIKLIIDILFGLLGAVYFHFIVFSIIGLFKKRTYPKTDKRYRYGLIIPARNEESVVPLLIESIQKNDYPQDKLQIFVIAHNCTDRTAEIARRYDGVAVYEYNNPEENTMGYAFRHLFKCIERDYGTASFDGFFLFNADNILDKDYIARMNDAYDFYGKECVITSFRNSKNFGANLMSGLYGMYFTVGCRLESRGRTYKGCSTRVQGTGYLINPEIVKDGWKYVSLAEDWEFTADQVLAEDRIRYCDDAIFYDEQPTTFRIMWRQRIRWSRGHLLVFYSRFRDMIRELFSRKTKYRGSVYDITANILPIGLFIVTLQVLQLALYFTAPLIDKTVTLYDVFIGSGPFSFLTGAFLPTWIISTGFSTVMTFLSAIIIFAVEKERIKGVSFGMKALISVFWPLFLAIQIPIDVVAFFSRNLGWKPIPHSDKTTFENVNER
ncbi:MAG: glycosyltransferase family 2 protein [Clostridia bacterium]|nr:glycosyltransferase family 2 protein [Clostridia bacterium]